MERRKGHRAVSYHLFISLPQYSKSFPQDSKSFLQDTKLFSQVSKSLPQDTKLFPRDSKSFPHVTKSCFDANVHVISLLFIYLGFYVNFNTVQVI